MKIDLRHVPFSRYGSYLAFSIQKKRIVPEMAGPVTIPEGLFLRNVHGDGGDRDVFRVELLSGSRKVAFQTTASPGRLRLTAREGHVDICLAEPNLVRFRSRGLSVRLTLRGVRFNVGMPAPGGRARVISFRHQIKFMFTPLTGSAAVSAATSDSMYHGAKSVPDVTVRLDPDSSGRMEACAEAYQTEWKPRRYPGSFDNCVRKVEKEFRIWLASCPAVPRSFGPARELAAYITWSAMVAPEGHFRRPAMLMSKNWMTRVWSWDHCFNALALASGNPEAAWDQLMLMFDVQKKEGVLPDAVSDISATWSFVKPPIHGWCLRGLMARNRNIGRKHLREIYDPLCRWTRWWLTCRDENRNGLPQYNHGNDSGWDNATIFDVGYPVEGSDLAAFLILQMDVLADAAKRLGRRREAAEWKQKADRLLNRLLKELWTGESFTARNSRGQTETRGDSLVRFIPIVLGRRLPRPVMEKLAEELLRSGRFLTPFGLATESPDSPLYEPDGYWRGPIWAPSTYLIVDGLRNAGYSGPAKQIALRFCRLCVKSGMAENFNALTGEGLRDHAYTWTASVFLLLAGDLL